MTEPLTPEEEAELRRDLADSPATDVGYALFDGPEAAEEMVARLLATLGVARAGVRAPDPSTALREAAQAILDRALDFFDPDDLDEDSSLAMPVTLKARHVAALRAALTPEPREDAS